MVKDGFRLDELRAAGFDILTMLSSEDDSSPDLSCTSGSSSGRRVAAALALASAVQEQTTGRRELQALLDGGVVPALVRMLQMDNRLSESSVTQVKCAAAGSIASLCRAGAKVDPPLPYSLLALEGPHEEEEEEEEAALPETFLDEVLDVLVEHGAVPLLMNLRGSCQHERRVAADQALRAFSVTAFAMHALATAGAIEPLVLQLLEGSSEQRGWAAQALCRFSSERDQAHASALVSVESHCVEGLVACLQHGETRFREAAAKALSNLASDDADMRFIASKGALQQLVGLLDPRLHVTEEGKLLFTKETSSCVAAVALALRNLAGCGENAKAICNKTPAVQHLVALLDAEAVLPTPANSQLCAWSWRWDVCEAAVCALGGVAYCGEVKLEIARTEGAVQKLVHLILQGSDR